MLGSDQKPMVVLRRTVSPFLLGVSVWAREFAILNGVVTVTGLRDGSADV